MRFRTAVLCLGAILSCFIKDSSGPAFGQSPQISAVQPATQPETITVDLSAPAHPLPHFWEQMFGSGLHDFMCRDKIRRETSAEMQEATGQEDSAREKLPASTTAAHIDPAKTSLCDCEKDVPKSRAAIRKALHDLIVSGLVYTNITTLANRLKCSRGIVSEIISDDPKLSAWAKRPKRASNVAVSAIRGANRQEQAKIFAMPPEKVA